MKMKKSRRILLLIGMLIGIAIFSFMVIDSFKNLTDTRKDFTFNLIYLGYALMIFIVVYLSQMLNLWLIIRSYHPQASFHNIRQGFSLGLIPKYIPGYIWGYLSRGEWYLQNEGIPVRVSWIATIIEIYITLLSGLIIVTLNYFFSINKQLLILLIFLIAPIIGYLIIMHAFKLLQKLIKKKRDWDLHFKMTLKEWSVILINSSIQWCLLGFGIWLIQKSFSDIHGNISFPLMLNYSSTFSMAWLSGFVMIFIPNGLGVREFVLRELLATQMGFLNSAANLISILSRILLFIAEGILFFIASIIIPFQGKQRN